MCPSLKAHFPSPTAHPEIEYAPNANLNAMGFNPQARSTLLRSLSQSSLSSPLSKTLSERMFDKVDDKGCDKGSNGEGRERRAVLITSRCSDGIETSICRGTLNARHITWRISVIV